MSNRIQGGVLAGVPDDRLDEGIQLYHHAQKFGDYELELRLSEAALEVAVKADPLFLPPKEPTIIARYKASTRTLTTHPINTNFGKYFLTPKYDHINAIVLEDIEPLGAMRPGRQIYFEELPAGLIREPFAGFGLNYEMRFIAEAAGRLEGIATLQITDTRGISRTQDTLLLSYGLFDKFRKSINRTHKHAIGMVNTAKAEYLDANFNVMLDPSFKLPEGDGTRRPIADILAETLIGKARSPDAEAKAAARTVKKSVKTLAEKEPAELLDLRREIELVSLEELIEIFEKKLGQTTLQERHWQDFFSANAFVLQLAFNLPAIAFGDQVAVGGTKFDGRGGKLADYAIRLGLFGNLALVEIKTPKTPLLAKREYRGGVFAPSDDLSGAVTQVLDQRHQLQMDINNKKVASKAYDVFTYAVPCIVIAGQEPGTDDERKSLELYRNNLRDVIVITFDELLAKLKSLHEFLSKKPEPPPPPNPAMQDDDLF